ncbi:hypothetical protein E4S40_09575 [Algoriphagus kandeliae]|uniref:Uncharacterized protein n=1 Tax=Algoriphagus kandeliae TaxID=2562278 RepID=A0A4Y9QTK5_9BACT|nr:hypothetical protein [Algoriphagus kandeliae]TFV94275.1 hypothetical protein E4S40_09575 [Algoriphagus kandeliae]
MGKKKAKKSLKRGWLFLVILIWAAFLYEIIFMNGVETYGIKEWVVFSVLTFWLLMELAEKLIKARKT